MLDDFIFSHTLNLLNIIPNSTIFQDFFAIFDPNLLQAEYCSIPHDLLLHYVIISSDRSNAFS